MAPGTSGHTSRGPDRRSKLRSHRSKRAGALPALASNAAGGQRLGDPGNDLVEHVLERGGRLETEHPPGLVDGRNPPEHVMLERRVVLEPQRDPWAFDLAPDR